MRFLFLTVITLGLYPVWWLLKAVVRRLLGTASNGAGKDIATGNELASPACPHCGAIQEPPPQRKRKCQDCGQFIYVRKLADGKRHLLTEKYIKEQEQRFRNEHWKELSQTIQKSLQEGNWEAASQAYFGQAQILFAEGKNHLVTREEGHRCKLLGLKALGIQKVRVMTCQDGRVCAECRELEGQEFSVEEALEKMLLPGRTCEDAKEKNQYGGRCRCLYSPIFRHETMGNKS